MVWKCPNCGYSPPEPPAPPYEYNGYLKEHLPLILMLLKDGKRPAEISDMLGYSSAYGNVPAMISYIGRRYGVGREDDNSNNMRSLSVRQRDRAIARRYVAGGITLKKLGEEYKLSREQIRIIVCRTERVTKEVEAAEKIKQTVERIEDVPLKALDLPFRVYGCLRNEGCETVGDALKLNDFELLRVSNFGRKSLSDWKYCLDELRHEFAERTNA
jgi:hypothetical protein